MSCATEGFWPSRRSASDFKRREEDDFVTLRVKDGKLQMDIGQDDFHDLNAFDPAHFHVADVSWATTSAPYRLQIRH
jgi:hypothetical protein